MNSNKKVILMFLITSFCSCHINAAHFVERPDINRNMKPVEHQSGVRDVPSEVPKSEKMRTTDKQEQNAHERNQDKSLESKQNAKDLSHEVKKESEQNAKDRSYEVKKESDLGQTKDLIDFSELEGTAVDLGKNGVEDKALIQKMYEYVKSVFDQIGIALKDILSSWSKMSSKQVDKLALDIDAITTSVDRFPWSKSEGDAFLQASEKASQDVKSLSELSDKIKNMPEGSGKKQMQESIDKAIAIVVNDIANLIYFKPDSVDISPILADLPQDVQNAVKEMVDWKAQKAATKAPSNSQKPGIFDEFAEEQKKSSEEIVSDYKNKQSERALAAQKKVEAKMKEKPTQTPEQALNSVKLKKTSPNEPQLFLDEQTDFSSVTANSKQSGKDLVTLDQQPVVKVAQDSAQPVPSFLNDVVAKGQSGLKPVAKSAERSVNQSDLGKKLAERRTNIEADDVEKLDMEGELSNQTLPAPTPKSVSKKIGSTSSSQVSSRSASPSPSAPASPRGVDVSRVESGFNTGLLKRAQQGQAFKPEETKSTDLDTEDSEWE